MSSRHHRKVLKVSIILSEHGRVTFKTFHGHTSHRKKNFSDKVMSRRNFQNGKVDECWKSLKNVENFDLFQVWKRLKTFWWGLLLCSRYLKLSPSYEQFIKTNHKAIRRIEMNLKAYRWPQHIFGVKTVIFDLLFGVFWPFLAYPMSTDRPKK